MKYIKEGTNHTIMIMERGFNVWITLLTSKVPNFKEYRFTFSDGVVRYLTMAEIIQSPFFEFGYQISKLTDAIDEERIKLVDGQLYVYNG
jgi:hypothetical protein